MSDSELVHICHHLVEAQHQFANVSKHTQWREVLPSIVLGGIHVETLYLPFLALLFHQSQESKGSYSCLKLTSVTALVQNFPSEPNFGCVILHTVCNFTYSV